MRRILQRSILPALLIALIASAACADIAPDSQASAYARAAALMEQGSYDAAIAIFDLLDGYEDSAAQRRACEEAKDGLVYEAAAALMDEGRYAVAASLFALIPDHPASEEQRALCETAALQARYDKALALSEQGGYEKAEFLFDGLGDFGDSKAQAERMREVIRAGQYADAEAFMERGEYEAAEAIFLSLGEYQGSAGQAAACRLELSKRALLGEIEAAAAIEAPLDSYAALVDLAGRNASLLLEFESDPLKQALYDRLPYIAVTLLSESPEALETLLLSIDDPDALHIMLAAIHDPEEAVRFMELVMASHPERITQEHGQGLYEAAAGHAIDKEEPGTALEYLGRIEASFPGDQPTEYLWRQAYIQLAARENESILFTLYADVDLDSQDELIVSAGGALRFYELAPGGIAEGWPSLVFGAEQITMETDGGSRCFLFAQSASGELLIVELTGEGPVERIRRPQIDSWSVAESGMILYTTFTQSPLRTSAEELLFAEQGVQALPPVASVELEGYPMPDTLLGCILSYQEALKYAIPEELALYEAQPDQAAPWDASPENLETWLSKNERIYNAACYLRSEETGLRYCIVTGSKGTANILLVERPGGMPAIAGLVSSLDERPANGFDMLALNEPHSGVVAPGGEEPVYQLFIPQDGSVTITFSHSLDAGSEAFLLSGLAEREGGVSWQHMVSNQETVFSPLILSPGFYRLALEPLAEGEAHYTISADYAQLADCEVEPNGAPEFASPIYPGRQCHAALAMEDDVDLFRLTLEEPGEVTIHVEHSPLAMEGGIYRLDLLAEEGEQALLSADIACNESDWGSSPVYLAAGDYFLRMSGLAHVGAPYAITASHEAREAIELERNDTREQATPIALNTMYHAALSYEGDMDIFAFTLDAPGMVRLDFAAVDPAGDGLFALSLHDARPEPGMLATQVYPSVDANLIQWPLYLDAGIYYFSVSPEQWDSAPYRFTWSYEAMKNIELEPNGDYESATALSLGKATSGALSSESDVDRYAFTLLQPSEITIEFSFAPFDNGSEYFEITLEMMSGEDGRYYEAVLSGRDSETKTHSFYLGAGDYCFSVRPAKNWTARPYTALITAKPHSGCELEWNNTRETATPLALGQKIYGALRYDGDVDIYQIEVTQPQSVSLYFDHGWIEENDLFFSVRLEAQSGEAKPLLELSLRGNETSAVTEKGVQLKSGVYYVVVEQLSYSPAPYALAIK